MDDDNKRRDKPQDDRDEPGTDGDNGGAADVPAAVPSEADSARGDNDQHSDAQARARTRPLA